MKEIKEALKQHMTQLFWSIVKEKEALTMDGVWGYNDKAQFVAGKAINLCSYVACIVCRLPGIWSRLWMKRRWIC